MTSDIDARTRTGRTAEVSRREFLVSLGACGLSVIAFAEAMLPRPSAASTSTRLIDVHHHFAPPFYLPSAREQFIAMGRSDELSGPLAEWTPEKSVAEMDRNGVEYAVLSLTTPAVWLGDVQASRKLARRCNEYAAEVAAKYAGRFGFFAAIPLPDTEGSLQEAAYALQALKADGIGLLTSYNDKWPGDPVFAPVFDELNHRKAVVYFHPTAPVCCRSLIPGVDSSAIEFPHDTTRAITSLLLSGSLSQLSDIKFVFSHAGGTLPMVAGRIADLASDPEFAGKLPHGVDYELKRLHYEIAFSANKPALTALRSLVPTSQIMFGSDFPFYSIDETARGMRNVGLSDSELKAIGRENAMTLLPRRSSS
jgi:6-methylsalicylate decarboxylase